MRLRRLTLRNFRAWKEQIIDFGHGPDDGDVNSRARQK